MKAKFSLMILLVLALAIESNFAQKLPNQIKKYLDGNYKGWKLQKDECYPDTQGKAIVKGNFNGDKKLDYAVKFGRGNKGFIIAFLAQRESFKPFVLHYADIKWVKGVDLDVWKKGDYYTLGENRVFVKFDAPSDFQCESDIGGIHLYRNGKFISY